VGYFAQHQTDELDFDATPLIELSRRRPKDLDLKLRNHLGRFGFSQQRAETRTGDLSGGEKARLLFAMMSSDEPHILLLDEPTNHLDVVAREALVQAINAFEGAVVIVSHDPHVIELTADRLWLVDQGTVTPYDGDLDDYRKLLTKPAKNKDKVGKANEPVAPVVPDLPKKEQRRLAAEKRNELAPLRKRVKRAEDKVIKLTSESERLQTALAAPDLYEKGDTETVKSLQVESGYAAKTVADAEEAWLELQEELETAEVEAAAAS
jgi:ATP-binding cassette subfamily F protein 3